jgi:hypothetical protein
MPRYTLRTLLILLAASQLLLVAGVAVWKDHSNRLAREQLIRDRITKNAQDSKHYNGALPGTSTMPYRRYK